jgi:Protein of unknown function (DUF2796)
MTSRVTMLGLTALAGLSLLSLDIAAQEPAHVHGVLHLDVAVEGKGYTVDLDSPLDNFLGFEHAPRDERENQAVRAMAARLRGADVIFAANRAAGCKAVSVSLQSAVITPALLGEAAESKPAKGTAHEEAHAGHADIDGSFEYACTNPGALHTIDVGLFDGFQRIHRIDVQLVTPKGQGKRTLTGTARQIAW